MPVKFVPVAITEVLENVEKDSLWWGERECTLIIYW